MISTRCWTPTGRSSTSASGLTCSPYLFGQVAHVPAGPPPVDQAERAGPLHAQGDVLGHGEHRDQHEVLVHHADAGLDRVARRAEVLRLAVDQDLALVRLGQPEQDVHQGVLPAPFSPSSAWIWPGSTVRSMWSLATRLP